MVKLELSTWLKPDEFPQSGELLVTFVDEGEVVDGQYGKQFEVTVEAGKGQRRRWSMNVTSQRAVASLLGDETSQWVGQQVQLFLATQMVDGKQKKVIYAKGNQQ